MTAKLILEPLTAEAFAPYGEVPEIPAEGARVHYEKALANARPGAWPSLSLMRRAPAALPLVSTRMERHRYSSQSFIPMDAGPWLVVVAPHAAAGGPDMAQARAFLARPDQGVTYGADVWHHPFTALERPASFAIMMWRQQDAEDEEFVTVPRFEIHAP